MKWEYMIVELANGPLTEYLLNTAGDSGWEMLTITTDRVYFKRQKAVDVASDVGYNNLAIGVTGYKALK
jgi:hypothetical protein